MVTKLNSPMNGQLRISTQKNLHYKAQGWVHTIEQWTERVNMLSLTETSMNFMYNIKVENRRILLEMSDWWKRTKYSYFLTCTVEQLPWRLKNNRISFCYTYMLRRISIEVTVFNYVEITRHNNPLVCFFFTVSALRCWRCSSDASNAAFCNDPFDSSIITEQQRRWSFVECSYPPGQLNPYNLQPNQRPVCKKTKQWGE